MTSSREEACLGSSQPNGDASRYTNDIDVRTAAIDRKSNSARYNADTPIDVWRFQSSAFAVSQPASAGSATTPSQHVRAWIVFRCSSDGLELVSGLFGTQRWASTTSDRH